MTAVRYRDEILRPVAVPLVQQRNLILQQDNARPHVARVCQDFLANNNIAPLEWPPYSPDLTPIEHMWGELDRRVRKRRNPPATLAQLRNALIDEWNNIPMRTVNALVNSIQRRIRVATAARGGHTRYWFSVWFWFQDLGGSYQWTSITCWSQTNEIWNFCSIHVPFCNHSKIFNTLFQTWMKFRNKIYPAFLFPFSIHVPWGMCSFSLRKHAYSNILKILQPKRKIYRQKFHFIYIYIFLLKT